ncbi:MAG: DUF4388 domain-containing protein, partial [Candidatus Melainabacteria bacterium]|nr:DUF4388 domain-containing protein [Candidatus Melainabacteria bacterium]
MLPEEISSQDAKTIRLIKHPRAPAEAQIEDLLSTAKKNMRLTVELPFNESAVPYMLSSFVESAKAECFWMFYRGVGPDSTLLWNMVTDDTGLIHHLMTSQFPQLETGFTPVPKSKAVARAVANYKDAQDLQLPADSEFEVTDTSATANFPKSAKPEHDLLTLPDQGAQESKKVRPEAAPVAAQPETAQPVPLPFPQQANVAAPQPTAQASPAHQFFQQPQVLLPQEPAPAPPSAGPQAAPEPHHQNLEPPPGYTPLLLPQGVHLAHTLQAPPASFLAPAQAAQTTPGASSDHSAMPSFLAPITESTAQTVPLSDAQSVQARSSDKTLKLEQESQAKPPSGRGWLKDDRGTSIIVEPVAPASASASGPELDSPFVQQKKSTKATSSKLKARPMLEGDLTNLQMPTLLQSINMGKMTGRLDLLSGGEVAVIYFREGTPLHCQLRNSEGEAAIIETIGWDEGEFRFFVESPHHRETIKKRLDLLLMEGAALIDQYKFLKEIGVNLDSYLVRNHADITEQLFEEMVSRGAAAEMNLQKMLYQLIDNESTLEDLLRLRPMPKPRWVPVMFNLVTCSLVSFSDRPLREGVEEAAAENIDWPAIQAFEDSIKIAETGFLSYPAFFYHLEREYERFERFQRPFSLIILEISIKEELSETKD